MYIVVLKKRTCAHFCAAKVGCQIGTEVQKWWNLHRKIRYFAALTKISLARVYIIKVKYVPLQANK